ncbi:MAG: hypothetical protein K0R49_69 [Burkholderiales bacterium]|jgi:hypothetical protein|nr:hypothetical protein [Burkholderiales bacterium]
MIPAPQNRTQPQQTYSNLWATDPSNANFVNVTLAPSTNQDGYNPGCILAQYTSGDYQGQFVNYDPNGKDGQNIALLILTDQYLTPDMQKLGTRWGVLVQAVLGGATLYKDQVYFNKQDGTDDIVPAITQIGGKVVIGKVGLYAIGK